MLCDAAEKKTSHASAPVRAHHNKIGVNLLGSPVNDGGDIIREGDGFNQFSVTRHASRCTHLLCFVER
jgi:hypothetical protein